MPRLDYVATLQDSVSPGLRSLADTATELNNVLSGVTVAGTNLTQTLERGLGNFGELFGEVTDSLDNLVLVRLASNALGGTLGLLTSTLSGVFSAIEAFAFSLDSALGVTEKLVGFVRFLGKAMLFLRGTIIVTVARLEVALAALPGLVAVATGAVRTLNVALASLAVTPRAVGQSLFALFVALRFMDLSLFTSAAATRALAVQARALAGVLTVLRVAAVAVAAPFAVIGTVAALLLGAIIGVGFGLLFLRRNLESIGESVGSVAAIFTTLGDLMGDLVVAVVPEFITGFVGPVLRGLLTLAVDGVDFLVDSFKELQVAFAPDSARQAREALTELRNTQAEVAEGTRTLGSALDSAGQSVADLAGAALPPLIARLKELFGPLALVIGGLSSLTRLRLDTNFGEISLQIQGLFQTLANLSRQGIAATTQQVIQELGGLQLGAARALLTLRQRLPAQVREILDTAVTTLSDAGIQAQVAAAAQQFFSAFSRPENLIPLVETGELTPDIELELEMLGEAYQRALKLREDFQLALGLIDERAAERQARINAQATTQQVRTFLRTAGQLVRDRQDLAIALATIDAGVAIAGALSHGARYGPGYTAAYVATIAAQLANNINSIRSLSPPSVGGGIATPDTSVPAVQQAQVSPEVNVLVVGDRFSAQTVRDAIDEATRAATGQLSA